MKSYYYFKCSDCEEEWHYTKEELRDESGPVKECQYCERMFCDNCFSILDKCLECSEE